MKVQNINQVMNFEREETTKELKTYCDNEFMYIDKVSFPIIADMEKAILLLVNNLKSYEIKGNAIVFQTNGIFQNKRYFYRFFDFRPTFDKLDRTRNICVSIKVCDEDIIRIQAAQGFDVPDKKTEMVVRDFDDFRDFNVTEDDDAVVITTDKLIVRVLKDPWNITISDTSGKELYKQFGEETRSFMKYESCPFGFLYDLENHETFACDTVYMKDDEHFYGFGEKFTQLDKKGQNINLWNTNALGVYTKRTYKNVPFFVSSAGYGIFINTSYKANCNMGEQSYKSYSIMTGDNHIDNFFIYGGSVKKTIKRYTDITGAPQMPPKWTFGFWISKISYETQQEVEALAARFREEQIPCDVIHIDTNWYEENWVCDYKFSKSKFPAPKKMLSELEEQGFKVTLWQMPYIDYGDLSREIYDEGFQKGYFAFRPDGVQDFRHGLIDVSNPEAVKWYQDKLIRPLLEMGVKAIKVDFGESAPDFYQYAQYGGKEMHNLYALLYNKVVFDVTEDVHGKENAVIWARSTWAGSQRYPVHWGGDCGTDYTALVTSIKAGLGFGLSGFPFWSHDIGGFFYDTNPELYIRWMQVGVFTSHARTHGFYTREPWDFGDMAKKIAKDYLSLRYRLMPYIYSQAVKCVQESLPMMRALVIEYQDDETVHGLDNQYLFGDYMLIAPILDSCNTRKVYLPEGIWTDYWTKQTFTGARWIEYTADIKIIPVFIKQNAIIPMGPFMNYIDEKPCDPITLDLYPVTDGTETFELYDGQDTIHISMEVDEKTVSVILSADKPHNFEIVINNHQNFDKVIFNQKEWAVEEGTFKFTI